jgi:hypothetical protein
VNFLDVMVGVPVLGIDVRSSAGNDAARRNRIGEIANVSPEPLMTPSRKCLRSI